MLYTALAMGAAGSLHCAGMCSPLVMAATHNRALPNLNRLLYNAGRIFTYGLLGVLVSAVGSMLPLQGYTNGLSLLMGVVLVVVAVSRMPLPGMGGVTRVVASFTTWLKQRFAFFLGNKGLGATFMLGMLNGLLPCGLTMVALVYCVTLKPGSGFAYMIFFGLGTLPVMLGLASGVLLAIRKVGVSLATVTTGMLVLSGLLLIGRAFVHHGHQHATDPIVDIVMCR